jgi:hypothetical protein
LDGELHSLELVGAQAEPHPAQAANALANSLYVRQQPVPIQLVPIIDESLLFFNPL